MTVKSLNARQLRWLIRPTSNAFSFCIRPIGYCYKLVNCCNVLLGTKITSYNSCRCKSTLVSYPLLPAVTWVVRFYKQCPVHVMVASRFPHQELAQRVQTFADVTPLVEQSFSANDQSTPSSALFNDAQRLPSTVHLRCHDNRLAADAEARWRHDEPYTSAASCCRPTWSSTGMRSISSAKISLSNARINMALFNPRLLANLDKFRFNRVKNVRLKDFGVCVG